jgi:formylglycine-generating enzyme required for sulfatase activity
VQALAELIADGSAEAPGPQEITINLPGDVPLVMVCIPAGSFVMGSPEEERGRLSNEGPQTSVTISQGFYLGKYEVTQAQWLAVMGSWPGATPSDVWGEGPNYPAYYVNWNDAHNFITTLNSHISSTGQGPTTMRLPTEAEWEFATRAGTATRFSFGDSLSVGDECEDDGIRSQHMWYCGNNPEFGQPGFGTKVVGQKLPNAFGLHDVHGNVLEWCLDWYHPTLVGGSVTDPTGPASGTARVIRGGNLFEVAAGCRSAIRFIGDPLARGAPLGFRLAAIR